MRFSSGLWNQPHDASDLGRVCTGHAKQVGAQPELPRIPFLVLEPGPDARWLLAQNLVPILDVMTATTMLSEANQ